MRTICRAPTGIRPAVPAPVEHHLGAVGGLDHALEVGAVRAVGAPARMVRAAHPARDAARARALGEVEVLPLAAVLAGELDAPALGVDELDAVERLELHDAIVPTPSARMSAVPPVIRDVAAGLWIWRVEHPDWAPHVGWDPAVTSTCVESGGEVVVIDALVPVAGADAVWARLDDRPPTTAVVLKPDHVRERRPDRASASAPEPSARASSGATTSPRRTSSRSSPGASCRAAWLRSTTDAVATKRRSGFLSSGPSSSPTPSPSATATFASGARPGTRSACSRPCVPCSISRSSTSSSPTASRSHDRAAFERALELPPWVE